MNSIWAKLSLIVVLISFGGIAGTTLLSIKGMDAHFAMYVEESHRGEEQRIADVLIDRYRQQHGWGDSALEAAENLAIGLDYQIILYDAKKKERFASKLTGQSAPLLHGSAQQMMPLRVDGNLIGYLSLQRMEKSRAEMLQDHFTSAHTTALIWTVIPLTLVIGGLGVFLAFRITRPIIQTSKASKEAAQGNLHVHVPLPEGNDELRELVQSFNSMVGALRQQDELRRRLTSDISHELRTPVNTLLAQAEGMLDGIWPASTEHLEAMRREILRLSRIIQDLDQINRVETGEMIIRHERFSLSIAVAEVIVSMRPSFQREGVRLVDDVEAGIEYVGDRQRLDQTLVNLLSNALKHTPPEGEVTVRLYRKPNHICLQVSDTGSGIAEKDMPHVFKRFYRGDESRQRGTGGSGLGLTIVKGIVDAHGGEINIESKQGRGTTVTVWLPWDHTTVS